MKDRKPAEIVTGPELRREDYDFCKVPANELKSCLYYEYLRESAEFIRQVEDVRRQFAKSQKWHCQNVIDGVGLTVRYTKITTHPAIFEMVLIVSLASAVEFPKIPWQRLSQTAKSYLRNFYDKAVRSNTKSFQRNNPALVFDTVAKDASVGELTLNNWTAKATPKHYAKIPIEVLGKYIISGFFQFNLAHSHSHLINSFRDWLRANHPQTEIKTSAGPGRRTERDKLNALGALRLRHSTKTFNEATAKMKPLYPDRRSFNRACKAALKHFHTLLQVRQNSLPIHSAKGWQK